MGDSQAVLADHGPVRSRAYGESQAALADHGPVRSRVYGESQTALADNSPLKPRVYGRVTSGSSCSQNIENHLTTFSGVLYESSSLYFNKFPVLHIRIPNLH
jgi:hypothetical protein